MGKKVLIISTGLRKNGNSDLLAQPFARGAEEDEEKCERAINGLKGWIACFPKSRFAGSAFAGGVTDKGDNTGHKALDTAYDMGRNV